MNIKTHIQKTQESIALIRGLPPHQALLVLSTAAQLVRKTAPVLSVSEALIITGAVTDVRVNATDLSADIELARMVHYYVREEGGEPTQLVDPHFETTISYWGEASALAVTTLAVFFSAARNIVARHPGTSVNVHEYFALRGEA